MRRLKIIALQLVVAVTVGVSISALVALVLLGSGRSGSEAIGLSSLVGGIVALQFGVASLQASSSRTSFTPWSGGRPTPRTPNTTQGDGAHTDLALGLIVAILLFTVASLIL